MFIRTGPSELSVSAIPGHRGTAYHQEKVINSFDITNYTAPSIAAELQKNGRQQNPALDTILIFHFLKDPP
jgi:hypothetical protein